MAQAEYGVFCDALQNWYTLSPDLQVWHTAHLGLATAQRDMLNREMRDYHTYRVRPLPDVDDIDLVGNIATMAIQPPESESDNGTI